LNYTRIFTLSKAIKNIITLSDEINYNR